MRNAGSWTATRLTCTTRPMRRLAASNSSGRPGECAAGGRHVLNNPVAPSERGELRRYLRGRAEKYRPCRPDAGHCAARPAGQGACSVPGDAELADGCDNDSMYNTPPTFCPVPGGVGFDWLAEQGGLTAMEALNRRKAEKLYAAIDSSDFYANPVELASRSLMNIPFTLADAQSRQGFPSGVRGRRTVESQGPSLGGRNACQLSTNCRSSEEPAVDCD